MATSVGRASEMGARMPPTAGILQFSVSSDAGRGLAKEQLANMTCTGGLLTLCSKPA